MNIKEGGHPDHQRVGYERLREQVDFLSQVFGDWLGKLSSSLTLYQLFRGEFIFPTEGLTVNLDRTLHSLESDEVISVIRPGSENEKPVYIQLSDVERESGRENYDFYCFLIWPFIEASWLGAVSLMMLTPPAGQNHETRLNLRKTQDYAQLVSEDLY